jgi:putative inorganic carbon (hco3(-)) transporter
MDVYKMNSHNISVSLPANNTDKQPSVASRPPTIPPDENRKFTSRLSPFWQDRLFESGLILSMFLYYTIHSPLLSLPFLLVFAVLCWYRLSFAIALLPLTLPYYLDQKAVAGSAMFSLAEITLGVCVLVCLLQFVVKRGTQGSWLSWREVRDRLGPFWLPILVFLLFAATSIIIAYRRDLALRDFRKEILAPLLYLVLVLLYIRSRQDVMRLLLALVGTGALIALLGLGQYLFFKNTIALEDGVRRVYAVYGSPNSIGLLFDYVLPIALACLLGRVRWSSRLLALSVSVLMFVVLYLTHSLGAWTGIAVAALFVVVFSVRNRKLLLIGSLLALVLIVGFVAVYHTELFNYLVNRHADEFGTGTAAKRIYLWQTALNMIHDSPWFGYGLDNWLCHYSQNTICDNNLHHYWILQDPTGHPTGLINEPFLSHPHNIFLHVWVSIGVFGLLAFVAVLILFYWLFTRIFISLHSAPSKHREQLRWMTLGVGAAMLAALVQGQVDSSFLEQDLSFCFWTLVVALMLLRVLSQTSWRDVPRSADQPVLQDGSPTP